MVESRPPDMPYYMVIRHGERADLVPDPEPYPNNYDPPLTAKG